MLSFSILDRNLPLPDLLGPDDEVLPLRPHAFYGAIPRDNLRLWCHTHARYGIPTTELVDWLRVQIGHTKAIEIGAGHGDLCSHLGIPGTDNWCQTMPDVRLMYAASGQPTIKYPEWVERMSAAEAIASYSPDVVVASWVTHWIDPNQPVPPGGGNIYGVKENEIVDAGIKYILIGNETVHGHKPIMKQPHARYAFPWIVSRSKTPELDRIWIWNE